MVGSECNATRTLNISVQLTSSALFLIHKASAVQQAQYQLTVFAIPMVERHADHSPAPCPQQEAPACVCEVDGAVGRRASTGWASSRLHVQGLASRPGICSLRSRGTRAAPALCVCQRPEGVGCEVVGPINLHGYPFAGEGDVNCAGEARGREEECDVPAAGELCPFWAS